MNIMIEWFINFMVASNVYIQHHYAFSQFKWKLENGERIGGKYSTSSKLLLHSLLASTCNVLLKDLWRNDKHCVDLDNSSTLRSENKKCL
jgi:hypothetical protein